MKASATAKRSGEAAQQLRAYLASLPSHARRELQTLRDTIRAAVPGAVETISYRIPTFELDGRPLIYAAAWKEHTSLYPLTGAVRRALGDQLARYAHSKGTIRFPLNKALPIALVKKIVKTRVTELRGDDRRTRGKHASSSVRTATPRGKADVDAYLATLPTDKRTALQKLRTTIAAAAPAAEQGFSYGLPAFRLRGRPLVCYGASAKHCSLHPMSPAVIRAHAADLEGYELSKGTIRFVPETPLPTALVKRLVKARMAELTPAK
jgi:uncharacterized protein YdhG (YjbR/CyaY superfamily)